MAKFITRDNKVLVLRSKDKQLIDVLSNIIPRLSYDEILDGKLEERLGEFDNGILELSNNDDIKSLILSLAVFNSISKPTSI